MKKRILVIDDDKDILEPISLLLEGEGYSVEISQKGKETFKKVGEFKPDVILLDILMSGSDGRTICKKLKTDSHTKNIPIILMSAHPHANTDSLQSGADDFIAKPFETQDLIDKIAKFIKKN